MIRNLPASSVPGAKVSAFVTTRGLPDHARGVIALISDQDMAAWPERELTRVVQARARGRDVVAEEGGGAISGDGRDLLACHVDTADAIARGAGIVQSEHQVA